MYNIIFNKADIFVRSSVVDVFVNVITDILAGEATSEIIAFSLPGRGRISAYKHDVCGRCPDQDRHDGLLSCGGRWCSFVGKHPASDCGDARWVTVRLDFGNFGQK